MLMKHIAENPIHGLSGIATGAISTALEKIPILKQTGAGQKMGEALNRVGRGLSGGLSEVGEGFKGIGSGFGGLIGEGEQAKPVAKPMILILKRAIRRPNRATINSRLISKNIVVSDRSMLYPF